MSRRFQSVRSGSHTETAGQSYPTLLVMESTLVVTPCLAGSILLPQRIHISRHSKPLLEQPICGPPLVCFVCHGRRHPRRVSGLSPPTPPCEALKLRPPKTKGCGMKANGRETKGAKTYAETLAQHLATLPRVQVEKYIQTFTGLVKVTSGPRKGVCGPSDWSSHKKTNKWRCLLSTCHPSPPPHKHQGLVG